MNKLFVLYSALCSVSLMTVPALAEGCDDYKLSDGISVTSTPNGPKIMSTSTVSVAMDDQAEVIDATNEASLVAKSQIAEFLNNTIQSDKSLNTAIETQIKIVGDQKVVSKDTVKKQLVQIRSTSSALLKGAIQIGSCYTKGKMVMVTIGLKPETVGAASATQEMIQSGGSGSSGSSAAGSEGVDSFNNSKGIDQF
jgi:hypothetical protein